MLACVGVRPEVCLLLHYSCRIAVSSCRGLSASLNISTQSFAHTLIYTHLQTCIRRHTRILIHIHTSKETLRHMFVIHSNEIKDPDKHVVQDLMNRKYLLTSQLITVLRLLRVNVLGNLVSGFV